MAKKNRWQSRVNQYLRLLRQEIRIHRAMVFGSYARGNPRPDSDIDLAIFSPDFDDRREIENMQYLFKKTCAVDTTIEPHPFHPRDLKRPLKGTLVYEIVRTGKVVH